MKKPAGRTWTRCNDSIWRNFKNGVRRIDRAETYQVPVIVVRFDSAADGYDRQSSAIRVKESAHGQFLDQCFFSCALHRLEPGLLQRRRHRFGDCLYAGEPGQHRGLEW